MRGGILRRMETFMSILDNLIFEDSFNANTFYLDITHNNSNSLSS